MTKRKIASEDNFTNNQSSKRLCEDSFGRYKKYENIFNKININKNIYNEDNFIKCGSGSYSNVYKFKNSDGKSLAIKKFHNEGIPFLQREQNSIKNYLNYYDIGNNFKFTSRHVNFIKNNYLVSYYNLVELFEIFKHITFYLIFNCGMLPGGLIPKLSSDNYCNVRSCIKEYFFISLLNQKINENDKLHQIRKNLVEFSECNVNFKVDETHGQGELMDSSILFSYYDTDLNSWILNNISSSLKPDFEMLNKIIFQIFLIISLLEKSLNKNGDIYSFFAHRDLKPSNILIDTKLQTLKYNLNGKNYVLKDSVVVKICDFSLSVINDDGIIIDGYESGSKPKIGLDLTMFLIFILYQYYNCIINLMDDFIGCWEFYELIIDWNSNLRRTCINKCKIKELIDTYYLYQNKFSEEYMYEKNPELFLNPIEHEYFRKYLEN